MHITKFNQMSSNKTSLILVLFAMALATEFVASETNSGVPTIDRPIQRTTAFVPRLGKREQVGGPTMQVEDQLPLERVLCMYYGLYCNRLEVSPEFYNDEQASAYLALMSNLMRGIATQDGNLRLAPNNVVAQQKMKGEPVDLLDMMVQQLKREPRASEQTLGEMLSAPSHGGAKRVAFTPRIG